MITAIDQSSALVVIDMQKGIVGAGTVHPADVVLQNVVKLAEAFRAKKRPVVLVRVGWSADGGDALKSRTESPQPGVRSADFMEYADALKADPLRDILVQKRQWGAFYGTDLDLQLRRRGVTNLVFGGISTSIGVESSARDAFERGYNLTFVSDAMTDRNADAHDRALRIIFPRMGEVGTVADVLARL
ncbi:MAG TPA: hydrolase [Candidatus Baltobacteraceae bacterium]|nr:hydrolase [Candidatus Baltobacteraceae bacterium]